MLKIDQAISLDRLVESLVGIPQDFRLPARDLASRSRSGLRVVENFVVAIAVILPLGR